MLRRCDHPKNPFFLGWVFLRMGVRLGLIRVGWGSTDHIDLWDGEFMLAGDTSYLSKGDELWFWEAL